MSSQAADWPENKPHLLGSIKRVDTHGVRDDIELEARRQAWEAQYLRQIEKLLEPDYVFGSWMERDYAEEAYGTYGYRLQRNRFLIQIPDTVDVPIPGGRISLRIEEGLNVEDVPEKPERPDSKTFLLSAPATSEGSLRLSYPLLDKGVEKAHVAVFAAYNALPKAPGLYAFEYDIYVKPIGAYSTALAAHARLKVIFNKDNAELLPGPADEVQRIIQAKGSELVATRKQSRGLPNGDSPPRDTSFPSEQALLIRQIEATERLADEMAESNRLHRLAQRLEARDDLDGRLDLSEYQDTDDVAEVLNAIPDGMFDDVEW